MTMRAPRGVFTEHLRAWRAYRALNQVELSKAANVGLSTIIRAEKGKNIRASNARKLAAALGIAVEDFHQLPPAATPVSAGACPQG